jgi:hypothetical protein
MLVSASTLPTYSFLLSLGLLPNVKQLCHLRIQIRIVFDRLDPDPDSGGQKCLQKLKKVKKFHLSKGRMFHFET